MQIAWFCVDPKCVLELLFLLLRTFEQRCIAHRCQKWEQIINAFLENCGWNGIETARLLWRAHDNFLNLSMFVILTFYCHNCYIFQEQFYTPFRSYLVPGENVVKKYPPQGRIEDRLKHLRKAEGVTRRDQNEAKRPKLMPEEPFDAAGRFNMKVMNFNLI